MEGYRLHFISMLILTYLEPAFSGDASAEQKYAERRCFQETAQFTGSSLSTILRGNCGAVITLSCDVPPAVVKSLDVSSLRVRATYVAMSDMDIENFLSFKRYFSAECKYVILSCDLDPLIRGASDFHTRR